MKESISSHIELFFHHYNMIYVYRWMNSDIGKDNTNNRNIPSRRRIDGRLHSIGNTVFIPNLGYNGTIVWFNNNSILVLPHDYGNTQSYTATELKVGSGITPIIAGWLRENNIPHFDTVLLHQGTNIHPSCAHYKTYYSN